MAVYDFRLRPDDFWELTLRDYMKLLDRYIIGLENEEYFAAMICAAVYNTVPRKDRKTFAPQDFMAKKQKQEQQKRQQNEQDMRDTVVYLNQVFGGKDLREVSK